MTFIETIYSDLNKNNFFGTDEFSTNWLGQSRSYYTSLKSRNIEASNNALVNLLNKITEEKEIMNNKNNKLLNSVAVEYGALADKVCKEIAQRSCKHQLANKRVRQMMLKAIEGIIEQRETSTTNYNLPPIVVL